MSDRRMVGVRQRQNADCRLKLGEVNVRQFCPDLKGKINCVRSEVLRLRRGRPGRRAQERWSQACGYGLFVERSHIVVEVGAVGDVRSVAALLIAADDT